MLILIYSPTQRETAHPQLLLTKIILLEKYGLLRQYGKNSRAHGIAVYDTFKSSGGMDSELLVNRTGGPMKE